MAKRGRGLLEADVKQITDAYVTGEFEVPSGKPLTAYRIATAIKERDSLDELPTVGGVVYVLERWERIGFATFTRAPFAFEDYTEDGRTLGLAALGTRDREKRKAMRAAVREAEAEADRRHEDVPGAPLSLDPEVDTTPEVIEDDPVGADAVAADGGASFDSEPTPLQYAGAARGERAVDEIDA